jgi:molecular chaperone DnaK (HSP70)
LNDAGNIRVEVRVGKETQTFSPEEISAMLLSRLKEIAEDKLQQEVKGAIITVPAVSLFSIRQKILKNF